jgi:hypothetical protein
VAAIDADLSCLQLVQDHGDRPLLRMLRRAAESCRYHLPICRSPTREAHHRVATSGTSVLVAAMTAFCSWFAIQRFWALSDFRGLASAPGYSLPRSVLDCGNGASEMASGVMRRSTPDPGHDKSSRQFRRHLITRARRAGQIRVRNSASSDRGESRRHHQSRNPIAKRDSRCGRNSATANTPPCYRLALRPV